MWERVYDEYALHRFINLEVDVEDINLSLVLKKGEQLMRLHTLSDRNKSKQ